MSTSARLAPVDPSSSPFNEFTRALASSSCSRTRSYRHCEPRRGRAWPSRRCGRSLERQWRGHEGWPTLGWPPPDRFLCPPSPVPLRVTVCLAPILSLLISVRHGGVHRRLHLVRRRELRPRQRQLLKVSRVGFHGVHPARARGRGHEPHTIFPRPLTDLRRPMVAAPVLDPIDELRARVLRTFALQELEPVHRVLRAVDIPPQPLAMIIGVAGVAAGAAALVRAGHAPKGVRGAPPPRDPPPKP